MPYDRFLIAPLNTGLKTDVRPWLIPEDAFTQLNNAYIFRGRIRKRFGSTYMLDGVPLSSRLGITVATTDGSGNVSGTVPGSVFQPGQAFSVGNEIFTVYQTGTPADMLDTGSATVKTYNTNNGAFVINGAAAMTPVIFYPSTPVMGLDVYELGQINNQPSLAFDTQFAYLYNGSNWLRVVPTSGINPVWHGDDLNFFWCSNWSGITADQVVLFISNFNASVGTPSVTDDPIWAYSTEFTGANIPWLPFGYSPNATINPANLQPYTVTQTTMSGGGHAGDTIVSFVQTALIVLPFKDRLILLNTIETTVTSTPTGVTPSQYTGGTNTQYVNRCRYSINGSPFADGAWLQPNFVFYNSTTTVTTPASGAGFIDAPTEEAIVSAEFIKDRLIVYFQESTWELVYTGNQIQPFVWQKINTELGAEGTFSIVPFDTVVLGVGNVGVHACTGANVARIDNNIPDQVFMIKDKNEGVERVAGIRDYYTEMVYWTFPNIDQNPNEKYPNKVLVYNYKTGAWALNDDCITAFGYFEQQSDYLWQNLIIPWQEANFTWTEGVVQAQFRQIIAGNQQGWIFIVNPEVSRNAGVMQITNITLMGTTLTFTIINHTLGNEDYIYIENASSVPNINNTIFQVTFVTVNTVTAYFDGTLGGTYNGGATVARVSNIQIQSKQLNPYISKGKNVYLAKIDFCILRTSAGQITVDYFPSSSELSMIQAGTATQSIMGNGILETTPYALYPLEASQVRLWHPVYFQTSGEFIQFLMYFTPSQITNPAIAFSDFELEGMIWHTSPTSTRLQ